MMSLVNKSADWTPNYHKILIFSPPKSLKRLRAARIDQLADSNKPAMMCVVMCPFCAFPSVVLRASQSKDLFEMSWLLDF